MHLFQYRVRQVGEPLVSGYTRSDIQMAAREVALCFPALASCDEDVIKYLSTKIKAFLKQRRRLIKLVKAKIYICCIYFIFDLTFFFNIHIIDVWRREPSKVQIKILNVDKKKILKSILIIKASMPGPHQFYLHC